MKRLMIVDAAGGIPTTITWEEVLHYMAMDCLLAGNTPEQAERHLCELVGEAVDAAQEEVTNEQEEGEVEGIELTEEIFKREFC